MKQKYIWLTFIISLVTLVSYRTVQRIVLNKVNDIVFGVSKEDFVIFIAFIIFVILITIMVRSCSSYKNNSDLRIFESKSYNMLGIISGSLIVVDSIMVLINAFSVLSSESPVLDKLLGLKTKSLYKDENLEGEIETIRAHIKVSNISIVRGILGIAAGLFIVFIAIKILKNNERLDGKAILYLLPTLWVMTAVIEVFFEKGMLVSKDNDVFGLMRLALLLLFFLSQAKFYTGFEKDVNKMHVFNYGFIAIITMLLHGIPQIFYMIKGYIDMNFNHIIIVLVDIALSLYISFFLLDLSKKNENINGEESIEKSVVV